MEFQTRLIFWVTRGIIFNISSVSDKVMKEYSAYKPYLMFFGLVDGLYTYLYKVSC